MNSLATIARRVLPQARALSTSAVAADARPMTRFIQYPMDKTKMAEVKEWLADRKDMVAATRNAGGITNIEFSFCPGEGWLAARYIFDDLDDMIAFPDTEAFAAAKADLAKCEFYDASRAPHEFKGFFLPEV